MSQYKADLADQSWEKPMPGLRYKAARLGDRQLRLVEYTKDLPPHWCAKGHMGYVLEGELEIEFAGETIVLGPGDGVLIPSGEEHKHLGRVLSDKVRVVFVEDL